MRTARPTPLPPRVPVTPVFRALADPTRVRILHLLRRGPLCVGDLVAVLEIAQPKASRHLAYLRKAGLVGDERRGAWIFYRLAPGRPGFHQKLLDLLDAAAAELPEAKADQAALRKLTSQGGCCPQHSQKQQPRGTR
jgi:ArsR family transcriptional regulator, arsenate/arsenite/antimonite-responsive transcriptional repressor